MSEIHFTEPVTADTSWNAVTHVLSVPELLEPILEYAAAGEHWQWAKNLRLVNKVWRDAAFTGLCTCSGLPKVNLGVPDHSEFNKTVEKFEQKFPRGCLLPIAVNVTSSKINSSLYDFLTTHAPIICEVLINEGNNTTAAYDDSQIYNFDCCDLRKIIIHSCPCSASEFEFFSKFLERLLKGTKRLTTLELKPVHSLSHSTVNLPKLPSLQKLHCDLPFRQKTDMHYTDCFPNLLMLHRYIKSADELTATLGRGKSESCLRKLNLCSERGEGEAHISSEVEFIQNLEHMTISSFPKLESLSFSHFSDKLTVALLPVIFSNMTTLKVLRVAMEQSSWRYSEYSNYLRFVVMLLTGFGPFELLAHPSQYEGFLQGKNNTVANLQGLESLTITICEEKFCRRRSLYVLQRRPDMLLPMSKFLFESVLLKIPNLKSISFFGDVQIPDEVIQTWRNDSRDINFGTDQADMSVSGIGFDD